MFFVDLHSVRRSSSLLKVIYFLTGFGHQAVIIFFVLSGFLVSSAVIKRHLLGIWSWRAYAIDRLSRLYVVLIPGLLFGLLWDKTGTFWFASSGIYSHPLDGFSGLVVQNRMTIGALFGNALFLQTILCPPFGSNGPLWSLSNEFWYYVLFPVALSAGIAWGSRLTSRAIRFTMLTIGLAVFMKSAILLGFPIWMLGCVLLIAHSRFGLSNITWLMFYLSASSLGLCVCLIEARWGNSSGLGNDLSLGIAFSAFLFGILNVELGSTRCSYPRIARSFAGFSYSLYVLHFPLLVFLRAWIAPPTKWQPDATHLMWGVVVGTILLGFAWFVSVFTESKTRVVRIWLEELLQPHRPTRERQCQQTGNSLTSPLSL
jgi:peptidoglycan/LPS O-acetylase OafA/YrhL